LNHSHHVAAEMAKIVDVKRTSEMNMMLLLLLGNSD
jgi:hypothetical protein